MKSKQLKPFLFLLVLVLAVQLSSAGLLSFLDQLKTWNPTGRVTGIPTIVCGDGRCMNPYETKTNCPQDCRRNLAGRASGYVNPCETCDLNSDGLYTDSDAKKMADCISNPALDACRRDPNGDGRLDVTDVVFCTKSCLCKTCDSDANKVFNEADANKLTACILNQGGDGCPSDINGDGALNVVDIVYCTNKCGVCNHCDFTGDSVFSDRDGTSLKACIEKNSCPDRDPNGDSTLNVLDYTYCIDKCGPCRAPICDQDGNSVYTDVDAQRLSDCIMNPGSDHCPIDINGDNKLDVVDIVYCSKSCGPSCGNGVCDPAESSQSCPQDCGIPPAPTIDCKAGQIMGDLNGDGRISVADRVVLVNIIIGYSPPPANVCCADLTQDGKVTVGDQVKIDRILTGLDTSPGVCGKMCPPLQQRVCKQGQTRLPGGTDQNGCPLPSTCCGDKQCTPPENANTCRKDCKPACGNGICEKDEGARCLPCTRSTPCPCKEGTCPQDCPTRSACGNGKCELGESKSTCPSDCSPRH